MHAPSDGDRYRKKIKEKAILPFPLLNQLLLGNVLLPNDSNFNVELEIFSTLRPPEVAVRNNDIEVYIVLFYQTCGGSTTLANIKSKANAQCAEAQLAFYPEKPIPKRKPHFF